MSLLIVELDEKMKAISREVYKIQLERDHAIGREYDDRRKSLMYEDIIYNLGYIDTAIYFNDTKIFTEYAVWIYRLLCILMKDINNERIKEQMITHYEILNEILAQNLSGEAKSKANLVIKEAINVTKNTTPAFDEKDFLSTGKYSQLKIEYLAHLLKTESEQAIALIVKALEDKIPIEDLYENVLKEVMYEVGRLWYKNEISVDVEHFCTSTTQVALSQFYGKVFTTPKNGRKFLSSCIGSELHEMGVRMLSDLFEYNGWDCIYLGSLSSLDGLLSKVREEKPDLIGLSATMPQHLKACFTTISKIREEFGDSVKIMVGGRAFVMTDKIWKKWPVDFYAPSAIEALVWAKGEFKDK